MGVLSCPRLLDFSAPQLWRLCRLLIEDTDQRDPEMGEQVSAETEAAGPIRVLLVDDHRVVRAGLSAYLKRLADIEVIGEAGDGRQALNRIAELEPAGNLPDVVLMDLVMPVLDGIAAA